MKPEKMEEGAMNNTPESTLTNHGQVGNAGDASSLLQDLANWDAARSLPAPNFDKPQETSSLAKTSQEDQLEQRDLSEKPSTTDGTRSKTFPSASHPQRFSSGEAFNQQNISSFPSFPTQLDQGASSSLNAGTSQLRGSVEINVEEPSPSEDFENQTSGKKNPGERTLDEVRALCAPLLQAVMKGDWPSAKAFIEKHTDCVRVPITHEQESALHIAAVTKHTGFIEELLKLMNPEDLELKTKRGVTALHFAAQTGVVRIAKLMLKKNNRLSLIDNGEELTPLHFAAVRGERNMVAYLFLDSVTPFSRLTTRQRIKLLLGTASAGLYDIALEILKKDPNLARTAIHHKSYLLFFDYIEKRGPACGWTALKELARKPFAIGSESQLSFWKRLLNSWHKGIYHNALMRTFAHQLVEELWKMVNCMVDDHMTLLVEAAKVGNVEFLIILIRSNPDLLWQVHPRYGSLFHVAIRHRQESVFNLIDQVGVMKENITSYITGDGENMLHFAGKLAPADRLSTIAAIQMQQELLWFKKIKKIVPPSHVDMKNDKHLTPTELFKNEHAKLQDEGEKWMKQTANNCILVATLVATVVFTVAFNVPGGNDQTTGKPILLKSNWFTIFFISDAIALVFSSTSILVFLSILTSSYGEEDIFKSIPLRLLFGLAALFISIAGMVIAFSATCFLVYYSKAAWAPIVIIVLATIPITLFVLAHFQLWFDTIHSTYWSRSIFWSHKRKIF